MKSGNRLVLIASLALVASVCLGAPSFAHNETAALNARITELNRAGKYSEAIPLAQRRWRTWRRRSVPITAMSRRR
jgi:hypothetical protein